MKVKVVLLLWRLRNRSLPLDKDGRSNLLLARGLAIVRFILGRGQHENVARRCDCRWHTQAVSNVEAKPADVDAATLSGDSSVTIGKN